MDKNITWKELKALNDIYVFKQTNAKIQDHPYINHLINEKGLLDYKPGNNKYLISTDEFQKFYELEFLKQFIASKEFLEQNGIETSAKKNFTTEDVKTLMHIYENKLEFSSKLTNIEDFSGKVFDNSKYLKGKVSIKKAVLKILEIEEFPLEMMEHQWRLVVDNPNPKAIVLCENKSFLLQPWIAKEKQIKLWYVGGNNIKILDDIDEVELSKPIYYSCDWDLAGLQIYSRIKSKLELRNKNIYILYPNTPHKRIPTRTYKHKSFWNEKPLSGLNKKHFSKEELELILDLIKKDKWIEEESTNLGLMIERILN